MALELVHDQHLRVLRSLRQGMQGRTEQETFHCKREESRLGTMGVVQTRPEEVSWCSLRFLCLTFRAKGRTEPTLSDKEVVWQCLTQSVSKEMGHSFCSIHKEEVLATFPKHEGQKCPREKGLSQAFFLTL
eukprot:c23959_g1_i1 orf=1037-1429(+)